jgi:DNA-binding transcriptional ArsR family regulator
MHAAARNVRVARSLITIFAFSLLGFAGTEAPLPLVDRPGRATSKNQEKGLRGMDGVHILNHMVQCSGLLDKAFAAVSDPTRRGILERLGRGDASISDLAASFEMTLTGIKKHVGVLEGAGLVTTEKIGRVRTCRLGPRRLEDEAQWIGQYQKMLEARLNRLGEFLERTKGDPS